MYVLIVAFDTLSTGLPDLNIDFNENNEFRTSNINFERALGTSKCVWVCGMQILISLALFHSFDARSNSPFLV